MLACVVDINFGICIRGCSRCLNVRLHATSTIACLTEPTIENLVVVQVLMDSKVSLCGAVESYQLGWGETKRFQCQPEIVGNSVKIKKFNGYLTLCEVEVHGVYGKTALLYYAYYMVFVRFRELWFHNHCI